MEVHTILVVHLNSCTYVFFLYFIASIIILIRLRRKVAVCKSDSMCRVDRFRCFVSCLLVIDFSFVFLHLHAMFFVLFSHLSKKKIGYVTFYHKEFSYGHTSTFVPLFMSNIYKQLFKIKSFTTWKWKNKIQRQNEEERKFLHFYTTKYIKWVQAQAKQKQ